jgi:hypothetical protein
MAVRCRQVLCIHLKRFRHDGFLSTKISSQVAFPLEGLTLKPFLRDNTSVEHCKYDLVALVNHRGSVGGMCAHHAFLLSLCVLGLAAWGWEMRRC